jgi:hypothetical protein
MLSVIKNQKPYHELYRIKATKLLMLFHIDRLKNVDSSLEVTTKQVAVHLFFKTLQMLVVAFKGNYI